LASELRIGVLASGSGTNLEALLEADLSPGRISVVVSNVPGAGAIARAERAGVPVVIVDHRRFESREAFDRALVETLDAHRIDWVVFAGFMRLVTDVFLARFGGRVINIHPSLLPSFRGVDAQRQAIDAGVTISGCSVHLVDRGMDTGPILAQAAVPVLPGDDVESLRQRILAREHRLLPGVVRAIAMGKLMTGPRGPYLEAEAPAGSLESPSLWE
jgi:phosphoribosylglycinamide formyltransferase-1